MSETEKEFQNPIDKDKVAENPGLLPYAHTVGSAIIRPVDMGRAKGLSMTAMYDQTNRQLDQIRKQVELLMEQAQAIHRRVEVSEKIYLAEMNFRPVIGHTYHLYTKKDGKLLLSMIAPDEWGSKAPYDFEATVKMAGDHTWEVLQENSGK